MKNESVLGQVAGTIVRVVVAILVIFIVYKAASKCYEYGYRVFTEPAVSQGIGKEVEVTVTSKMSAMDIGKLFKSKGLTKDAKLFAMQYLVSEYKDEVKPGTYILSTTMTAEEMMAAMVPSEEEKEDDN